jgi:hypothetical protein
MFSLDSSVGSEKEIFPPYRFTFSTLHFGAFLGITIYEGMFLIFAAKATAPAWFPLVIVKPLIYQFDHFPKA